MDNVIIWKHMFFIQIAENVCTYNIPLSYTTGVQNNGNANIL